MKHISLKSALVYAVIAAMPITAIQAANQTTTLNKDKNLVAQYMKSSKDTPMLFTQLAKSAEINVVNEQENLYNITLSNIDNFISYFSNRPERVVGKIPVKFFYSNWNRGTDSFDSDPPNAALTGVSKDQKTHTNLVFALKDPVFNPTNNTVSFEAKLLTPSKNVPKNLGVTSLFIDYNWHGNNT